MELLSGLLSSLGLSGAAGLNAFIPLLPTTVFLLIGAWALGKGAPEWRAKLVAHPRFGRALRDWDDGRRVSRREIGRAHV